MHIRYCWENQKVRKRPLGRHRSVDNTKVDLRETGWDGIEWIDLAQDMDQWRAPVIMVLNFQVP
jgi:hypothetical protein